MKFSFKPSPNYRSEQTTSGIMRDVTLCLLAVLTFAIVWYSVSYGTAYGLRVFLMALFAVIAAEVTEIIWFKATGKDWKEIFHSYGWVTALILVLITRLNVSYYAVIVCTIVAIIFGKLIFGGFGQNIFNYIPVIAAKMVPITIGIRICFGNIGQEIIVNDVISNYLRLVCRL